MKIASKKSVLNAALKGVKEKAKADPIMDGPETPKKTYMVAGHFSYDVKKSLMQARVNSDKTLQQLMGEAFNWVCNKYGAPQAYSE